MLDDHPLTTNFFRGGSRIWEEGLVRESGNGSPIEVPGHSPSRKSGGQVPPEAGDVLEIILQ